MLVEWTDEKLQSFKKIFNFLLHKKYMLTLGKLKKKSLENTNIQKRDK